MIYLNPDDSTPLHSQIYQQLVAQILAGQYSQGELLPATRKMAETLKVSRNTVLAAYSQLVVEGYVESQVGSGYRIAVIPLSLVQSFKPAKPETKSSWSSHRETPQFEYLFEYGSVDNTIFPHALWKKSLTKALDHLMDQPANRYMERQGLPALQEGIATHLFHTRGVNCRPDQIIITSGHQYSMEIIANIFKGEDLSLALENPGYDGTRKVFENHDFKIHPIELESNGIKLDPLAKIQPTLLYLTPSHQYPTGVVLPIAKRYEILDLAQSDDFYVIEDDYDSELRYDTAPIPALYSLDQTGRTIYAGTFSKTLFPALRIAFLVLPENLLPRYLTYYERYNSRVSALLQMALADFMAAGHFQRHLSKIRVLYKRRQKEFVTCFKKVFNNQAILIGDMAGVHFIVKVIDCPEPDNLLERILNSGINVTSSHPYYLKPLNCPQGQFVISFASVDPRQYHPGLEALKKAIFMIELKTN